VQKRLNGRGPVLGGGFRDLRHLVLDRVSIILWKGEWGGPDATFAKLLWDHFRLHRTHEMLTVVGSVRAGVGADLTPSRSCGLAHAGRLDQDRWHPVPWLAVAVARPEREACRPC